MFRSYGRSVNKSKDPLSPKNDVVDLDVRTDTNNLDKNLKLRVYSSVLQDTVKYSLTY